MDFLDPVKRRRHKIILITGYFCLGILVLLSTVILLVIAHGYWYKNGEIIQNGLAFFSSHPGGAEIMVDGKPTAATNTRLTLPAAAYQVQLTRSGYRPWSRTITILGNTVQHYDYPFLIPVSLQTTSLQSFNGVPQLETETPNSHWLLVSVPAKLGSFLKFDLTNTSAAPTSLTFPPQLLTAATGTQSLELVEWSNDNRHVLLKHTYNKNTVEYILLDLSAPQQSINLTTTLHLTAGQTLSLHNEKFDQYYLYDPKTEILSTLAISQPTPVTYLDHIVAYKTFGDNMVLYISDKDATKDKDQAWLYQDGQNYSLRTVSAKGPFLLDLAQYSGDWYVVVGDTSLGEALIFKNPTSQASPGEPALALMSLKLSDANHLSFSPNARFIVLENGTHFALYDAENDVDYHYTMKQPLDQPQTYAPWFDSNHLEYVSDGKLDMFDFDGANLQQLMPAAARYPPAYDNSYRYAYVLAPSPAKGTPYVLTATPLLAPQDL